MFIPYAIRPIKNNKRSRELVSLKIHSIKNEIGRVMKNNTILDETKLSFKSWFKLIDLETNNELVPKSIILDKDTNKLVSKAYFPKSSTVKVLATTAKKISPRRAFTIFPIPTKDILINRFFSTR